MSLNFPKICVKEGKDEWVNVDENFGKQFVHWEVLPWIGCWNTPRSRFPNSANIGSGVEAFQHMGFSHHHEKKYLECNCCKCRC
jgi:hypothetical protein